MALLKLGSKSDDAFRREGQSWLCTTGLPTDVTIEVGETSFFLHKFPLLSRSGLLKKLIDDSSSNEDDGSSCVLQLHDVPGGDKTFELVSRFFYGIKIEITSSNVVHLRCAAEYLQMNESYGEGNLIGHTETFINELLTNWEDTFKALRTCEEVEYLAEELHIVSRCIDSLAMKACSDSIMSSSPMKGPDSMENPTADSSLWNGVSPYKQPTPCYDEWWYEDVSLLSFSIYKPLILAMEAKGMKPESIAGSLIHYIRKFVPLMNRQSSFNEKNNNANNQGTTTNTNTTSSVADQRTLVEEIEALLPHKKGVIPSKYLLRFLRTAMMLHASQTCIDNLEKRVGLQLDQVEAVDLLIPNIVQSAETLYDIDCVQRIIDHFMSIYLPVTAATTPSITEERPLIAGVEALAPMTTVASLVDGYLAEVAQDVNLKLPKFQALVSAIPDYARPIDDGLYHAIDVCLKARPWLTDSEREQFCRLMNCQKLSLEASTHAAQNERLPLRVIVQVLFFEQLRLRTSISSWLFVSDNIGNSQNLSGNLGLPTSNGGQLDPTTRGGNENLKERVSELEKECSCIRKELKKLARTKRGWSIFPRIFRRKTS